MLRAIWFLLKAALLTGAAVWLAERPGKVELVWQGYLIETTVGFLLAVVLALLLVWTLLYRLWRAFVSVPAVYRRYRETARREQGYLAITDGLVAVAAGDGRSAGREAERALRLIPDAPLAMLLQAQAQLMNGDAPAARRTFAALLDDRQAAFFGVRGLLSESLRAGNVEEALVLARRAAGLQPKRAWVVRTLFDLETRNRSWKNAEVLLPKAERLGVFSKTEALRHRQTLLLAQAEEALQAGKGAEAVKRAEKSFSLDPAFTPAALLLLRLCRQGDRRRAMIKTVLKAWKACPHPDLAEAWRALAPPPKKARSPYDDGRDVYLWMQQIYDLNPQHHDSKAALGRAAMDARMWREARELLTAAMDYRSLARLERIETGNESRAREWMEMAAEMPHDPKWICGGCGHAALDWAPLCRSCSAFNAYQWMLRPEGGSAATGKPRLTAALVEEGLISPPRAG